METGRSYDLLEITATVYEVGAVAYLRQDWQFDDYYYFDHDIVILPEPLRIYDQWNKSRFETSPDFYPEYGNVDTHSRSIKSNIPFIGIDFRNISTGFNANGSSYISGLDAMLDQIGLEVYADFTEDILSEINKSIDSILDRLPILNMWKEPTLKYTFRFVVGLENVYEKHYSYADWSYEYEHYIQWLGRVDINKVCNNLAM